MVCYIMFWVVDSELINFEIRGKLKLAVFCITDREKGGVLQLEETCPKAGQPVLRVLCSKNPSS